MKRVEFVGDWFCVGESPMLQDIQAGYNARLDAAFVATPAGWRFYLDPCPGGITRVLNQVFVGEPVVTPNPHLSVYRGGGGCTWFGEPIDFPDPKSAGHMLGHAAYWIKRLRQRERLARQALKKAESSGLPADFQLCRVLANDGKPSVIIPLADDGYPIEMPGEVWVHRAAWYGFRCRITSDYDLISD